MSDNNSGALRSTENLSLTNSSLNLDSNSNNEDNEDNEDISPFFSFKRFTQ